MTGQINTAGFQCLKFMCYFYVIVKIKKIDFDLTLTWILTRTLAWIWHGLSQWRHNERGSVSNHQCLHCLLKCRFRRRTKKTSNLRVTGLCAGNSPVTGEFPAQKASNAENVSIWWRHHAWLWLWSAEISHEISSTTISKLCVISEPFFEVLDTPRRTLERNLSDSVITALSRPADGCGGTIDNYMFTCGLNYGQYRDMFNVDVAQAAITWIIIPVPYPKFNNSFENRVAVDSIYGCLIFKWVAVTWQE